MPPSQNHMLSTSPTTPLNESSIPSKFLFEKENLVLPTYLKSILDEDLHASFDKCCLTAAKAFWSMRTISDQRQMRFKFLCPTDDFTRLAGHCNAIDRLIAWREDYDSANPTLAPTPKITRASLALCISREAYEEWAREYNLGLEKYMEGEYQEHRISKGNFEVGIEMAKNGGRLSVGDAWLLGVFFREEFLPAMKQWEECVALLALPKYEELVDELFWAVAESVEGGEALIAGVYGPPGGFYGNN
ncbi:hypothetical protein BDV12DRAFT_205665 [Aspergillus spectabilis]